MEELDFLIVGGGLAGITMAYELFQKGYRIKLVHEERVGQSSWIASGLINPITGKRFVKTWNWESIHHQFTQYYSRIEEHLKLKLLYPLKIKQILKSIEEENQWLARCEDAQYSNLISFSEDKDQRSGLSYGIINQAYRLDIQELLTKLGHYFTNSNVLDKNAFDFSALILNESKASYKQMRINRHIIFAEGYWIRWNPFFSYLPSFAVKGERFSFRQAIQLQEVYKHSYTLIPMTQPNEYWCGSNYIFDETNTDPSEIEKKQQLQFLNDFFSVEGIPEDYKVGIRPAIKDRRPVVGKHPKHHQLVCLNGYGTKGASLNPYCVQKLANHLLLSEKLPEQIDIARFNNYFNS